MLATPQYTSHLQPGVRFKRLAQVAARSGHRLQDGNRPAPGPRRPDLETVPPITPSSAIFACTAASRIAKAIAASLKTTSWWTGVLTPTSGLPTAATCSITILSTAYRPANMHRPPWGEEMDYNLVQKDGVATNAPATQLQRQSGRDTNSIVADAQFPDPAHGDYRVRAGSPALALGFVNFPMDQFGVQKPELKALARTPALPSRKPLPPPRSPATPPFASGSARTSATLPTKARCPLSGCPA